MPYPIIKHKEAYEMWKHGWSIRRISEQPGMPDRRELREWMKHDFNCNCGYHGWLTLRREEINASRRAISEEEQAMQEPEKEINGFSEEMLSPKILQAISEAVGIKITRELTGDLQADMVSTAYMILAKVRDVLPSIQIKDAFALRQILGVAVQILTAFRPQVEVQRDEEARIKIDFPDYPRGLQRIESEGFEE